MAASSIYRPILSGFGAAGAGLLCGLLGGPAESALLCGLLGGLLVWQAGDQRTIVIAPTPEPSDPFEAARPILSALVAGFSEPMLLIERQQVTEANAAASALLGQHIVGEDVRLAIRHPAAAERLIGRNGHGNAPIQLVGLGEADRRWEMTVHDIDPARRIVRLADRTNSYAAERMRVDFVANASHELRTPLATLLGFIETLQDAQAAEDPATRGRFLKIMFDEAKRMQRLVDDLISLSRIEGEKFALPDERVLVAPLISEVASAIRCDRIVPAKVEAGLAIRGDRAQLSQLLHNLIGNAVKYGRPDTPVSITAVAVDGAMVRIEVADQGEGIAPEHLPRLTERFYRVDPGRSRGMGGTGLGLAIVKHIVERHRGRLDIRSQLGVGTTVSVLLPAAPEPLS